MWVDPLDVIRDKRGKNTESVGNLGFTWVNLPYVIRDKRGEKHRKRGKPRIQVGKSTGCYQGKTWQNTESVGNLG